MINRQLDAGDERLYEKRFADGTVSTLMKQSNIVSPRHCECGKCMNGMNPSIIYLPGMSVDPTLNTMAMTVPEMI